MGKHVCNDLGPTDCPACEAEAQQVTPLGIFLPLDGEALSYGQGVSVLRKGRVLVEDTKQDGLVRVDVDNLQAAESLFFERQRQEIMRSLYPAARVGELVAQAHLMPVPEPVRRSILERLARVTYPLRSRLASWLVGRDVDADDAEPDSDGEDW